MCRQLQKHWSEFRTAKSPYSLIFLSFAFCNLSQKQRERRMLLLISFFSRCRSTKSFSRTLVTNRGRWTSLQPPTTPSKMALGCRGAEKVTVCTGDTVFLQIDPFIHLSSAPCGPDGSNLNMLALAFFFFFYK